ncbi:MAG: acyl carrier protein [Acidobacteriota bacterium]|nr:MAG: acyl carrier protein [Acidobacteriota bacterium]
MTHNTELQNRIVKLLSDRVHIDAPSVDTDLMESGLLDSLTLVELMTGLEDEFGVRISFDDIELDNFRSVTNIARYVIEQLAIDAPAVSQ